MFENSKLIFCWKYLRGVQSRYNLKSHYFHWRNTTKLQMQYIKHFSFKSVMNHSQTRSVILFLFHHIISDHINYVFGFAPCHWFQLWFLLNLISLYLLFVSIFDNISIYFISLSLRECRYHRTWRESRGPREASVRALYASVWLIFVSIHCVCQHLYVSRWCVVIILMLNLIKMDLNHCVLLSFRKAMLYTFCCC